MFVSVYNHEIGFTAVSLGRDPKQVSIRVPRPVGVLDVNEYVKELFEDSDDESIRSSLNGMLQAYLAAEEVFGPLDTPENVLEYDPEGSWEEVELSEEHVLGEWSVDPRARTESSKVSMMSLASEDIFRGYKMRSDLFNKGYRDQFLALRVRTWHNTKYGEVTNNGLMAQYVIRQFCITDQSYPYFLYRQLYFNVR